jgi:hypothetical protein
MPRWSKAHVQQYESMPSAFLNSSSLLMKNERGEEEEVEGLKREK